MSKNKNRINIVYSTNPNYHFEEEQEIEQETLEKTLQELKVSVDRKQRGGKSVTLVTGFIGNSTDLDELGKTLKTKCGVGGNVKNGEILIQGELKEKVFTLLVNLGYKKTKKIGG